MPTCSAWVSDEIYKKVKDVADKNNTTPSKVIKSAIENVEVRDKKTDLNLLREINRIGNNINQLAKRANENKSLDRFSLQALLNIETKLNELL